MEFMTENTEKIVGVVLGFIGLCSIVAAMTPNKSDDKIIDLLLNFINVLGVNVGKAKNEK